MKQSEKNRKSREHILTYAFSEFSKHGYGGSSINSICTQGSISKGLLYHYYPNKDALYLACIEQLFADMTSYLCEILDVRETTMEQYFNARMHFFQAYPDHRQLFYDVLIYPQMHLEAEIRQIRVDFDTLNQNILRSILKNEKLADHISPEDAIQQLRSFINFLGVYVREGSPADADQKAQELLHTMLYGLFARETT